ncbi:MAG: hypothetical protein GY786_13535 [Proteobacteria bacterium]|nr:hypothetical protein [Pseudomonadota bacterium]
MKLSAMISNQNLFPWDIAKKVLWIFLLLLFVSVEIIVMNGQSLTTTDQGNPFNQINPVDGSELRVEILASTNKESLKRGEQFILTITGRVAEGQHIYSIVKQGGFAPEPTSLTIESSHLTLSDQLRESLPQRLFDGAFEQELLIHSGDFELNQPVKIGVTLAQGYYQFYGNILYQICDNRICSLPQKKPFSFDLTIR